MILGFFAVWMAVYVVSIEILDMLAIREEQKKSAYVASFVAILVWIGFGTQGSINIQSSRSYDDFDYSVSVSGSSINIKVPYPSTGFVGVGITSLHVEPSKIGNEILSEFQGIKGLFKSGEYTAQLYFVSPDSYGGIIETGPYVLFSAQASDLNRFENYRYFNKAYDFENRIFQAANQ